MAGFIKSVLVFTLIVTVMKGLVNNDSFRMYFKFFSGLVLILLMISPLVNFLSGDGGWYSLLEQEIFNFSLEGINDELEVADGKFEEIIREECREDIKEQVRRLAGKRNIDIKDIDIKFLDNSSSIQLASVDIGINRDNMGDIEEEWQGGDGNSFEDIEDIENIEDVDISTSMDVEAVGAMSGEGNRKKASGKNIQKLKEDISSYFIIKEAAINIWE